MPRLTLLSLQVLVAVVAIALWQVLATVPIFGRLGDYYGRKPFVIASIVVFTAASVLCGMANSTLFLVLARGLQGIGGADGDISKV